MGVHDHVHEGAIQHHAMHLRRLSAGSIGDNGGDGGGFGAVLVQGQVRLVQHAADVQLVIGRAAHGPQVGAGGVEGVGDAHGLQSIVQLQRGGRREAAASTVP